MKQNNEKNYRVPILRERLNNLLGEMSIKEFADKVGLSRQTMGFYLNGDRIPDSETLIKICQKCDVSADWLLGLTEDPSRHPCAADELGLSVRAIEAIKFASTSRGFEDCISGLNFLIERGDILSLAAFAYRLRDFVRESRRIERSYSNDTHNLADATHLRDVTNISISNDLEHMIYEKYPYLEGHFRVIGGTTAVRMKKDEIVRLFDETISRITGYNSFMDEVAFRNDYHKREDLYGND